MARHRAHETRLAGIVAEDPADCPDSLAQGAVGDDDIAPDAIEDVAAMHGLAAPLDEKHKQVEIPRDERLLAPVADEQAASRRQDEFVETIARHTESRPW